MSLVLHQSKKLSTGTTSPLSMWKPSLCSKQPSKIDQKTNKQTNKQKERMHGAPAAFHLFLDSKWCNTKKVKVIRN